MIDPSNREGSCYLTPAEITDWCSTVEGVTIADVVMASDLIDGYLGKSYAPQTHTERVKLKKKRGRLHNYPVSSISSVHAVTETIFGRSKDVLNPSDIEMDTDNDGYFTYIGSFGLSALIYNEEPVQLEIQYTSGFTIYPSRLKTATAMLACNIRQAQSFAGAKQLQSLDFQYMMTDDSFFTSDIKLLLKGLSA